MPLNGDVIVKFNTTINVFGDKPYASFPQQYSLSQQPSSSLLGQERGYRNLPVISANNSTVTIPDVRGSVSH